MVPLQFWPATSITRSVKRLLKTVPVAMITLTGLVAVPTPASSVQTVAMQTAPALTYEDIISDPSLTPDHSIIIRFYQAVLGREPEVGGLVFWLEQFDSGEWSPRRIAAFFVTSPEFMSLYGENTSNEEFVETVYENVLRRQPDAAGAAFWIDFLDRGNSRAELILLFSNDTEFIEANWLPSDGTPNPDGSDPQPNPGDDTLVTDDFSGTGSLIGYTTTNPEVLPVVGRVDGRYRAEVTDNTGNQTLHFHGVQGRLDAMLVTFPFDYVARNIGIGSLSDSQVAPDPAGSAYIFSGVQVHSTDLNAADSAHVVVGHRGNTRFTIEGKNTVAGQSRVNDIGGDAAPDGRADIRIVGNSNGTLTVYWQVPRTDPSAADDWQLYRGTGQLPGPTADFGSSAYIGLITYAYGTNGVPFVGTADGVELAGE